MDETAATTSCPDRGRLAALLSRTLRPDELGDLESHIVTCNECRRQVALLSPEQQPSSGAQRIGRYVVIRKLGEGGMGVVYAARDPALRRDIALKVLRGQTASVGPGDAIRMRREAQGLARLAHPNVVSIYDVGTHDDEIYLAMELIEGGSLATWLEKQPRAWRSVARVLLEAAEGLAAAHGAGLVHRDIKPHNVMVTTDDRAKVVDFGLAYSANAAPDDVGHIDDANDISQRVTATGAFIGTPLYSAPEVLAGQLGDARSDVFSFCVMAYEALYGRRPYEATTFAELRDRITKPIEVPRSPRLPRVLRRMVLQGLAVDPAARPAVIGELVPSLRAALWPRGKIVAGGLAGLAVLAGVSVVAARVSETPAADPCALDQAGAPTWTGDQETRVRTAFAATKRPYAAAVADQVVRELRTFPGEWAGARRTACLATRVQGVQSDELFDLRLACLEQRARGVATLTGLFEIADGALVERAANATLAATSLAACDGGRDLLSPMRPPSDPARATRFAAARIELDRADTLLLAGKRSDAAAIAQRVKGEADAIGHPALGARAARIFATVHSDRDDAKTLFEDAARRAEAAGDDRTRVEVALQLVQVWNAETNTKEVAKLFGDVDAIMTRIGAPTDLVAKLAYQRGRIGIDEGTYVQAENWLRTARLLQILNHPSAPDTLAIDSDLALVVAELGRLDEADRLLAAALAVAEHQEGATHPEVNALHLSRGQIASAANNHALARDELTLAAAGFDTGEGNDKASATHARADLARVLVALGDHPAALRTIDRAIADLEQLDGPDGQNVGTARKIRAEVLAASGDPMAAVAEFDRALAIVEKVIGPDHARVGSIIDGRGKAQLARGQIDAGIADLTRARAIYQKAFGTAHPTFTDITLELAEAYLRGSRAPAAVPLLEGLIETSPGHRARATELLKTIRRQP
ncbi:MAG: Protein kinase [Myxococcales bacterium]|nr:Protein kinase [Myxococcales bacterium]